MKNYGKGLMWTLIAMNLYSCTSLLPVNNSYEKAGTLRKGNVEVAAHATKYDVNHYGRTETSNRNYGLRAGYGVTDRFDLKFRYEKLHFSSNFDGRLSRARYIGITPKIAAVPGKLSFMMPVGYYSSIEVIENIKYKRSVSSVAPQMLFTLTNRKQKMDVTLGSKMDFLFDLESGENDIFLGISLGAGFSTDLNKWAIRPEIGVSTNDNKTRFISYGIGLQFVLPGRR